MEQLNDLQYRHALKRIMAAFAVSNKMHTGYSNDSCVVECQKSTFLDHSLSPVLLDKVMNRT